MLRINTLGGLWIDGLPAGETPPPRPRWLALLAILAAARDAGASRDRLLGVLWPERDESRARHALSQTLYSLRRVLGVDVVVTEPTIRLDPEQIRCDLDDFRDAVQRGEWDRAIDLYRGPFLDGFYLQDAPVFDQWVEAEREAIKAQAVRALEGAYTRSAASADRRRTADLAARLTRVDPLSSRFALRYMEALVSLGDRAGALAHERSHADAVRETLDAEPDAAVTAFAESLRVTAPGARPTRPAPAAPPADTTPARPAPSPKPQFGIRRWAVGLGVAGALALALWLGFGQGGQSAARSHGPTLAVGLIRDVLSPDSAPVSDILADMLTTSLSRLTALDVVATSRLLELVPEGESGSADARVTAARRAGATEILEGDVAHHEGGLRFDFRRVDLRSGMIKRGYRVTGATRYDLIDSATVVVASDLRTTAPAVSVAEITTRSPIAYRFYEEGLRAFYQFDLFAAGRLFRSALREDSTFALAAYYAWRSALAGADTGVAPLAARAIQLTSRASSRDRLIIRAHIAAEHDDPAGYAAAESLVTAFPNDPEALARAADVFRVAGEPLSRVVDLLERATAIDSAAFVGADVCRACIHLGGLAGVYRKADLFPEAETALNRWAAIHPGDPAPWVRLGELHDAAGAFARADSAFAIAWRAGGTDRDSTARAIRRAAAAGSAEQVATRCRPNLLASEIRLECARGFRTLGRLNEALRVTRSAVGARGGGMAIDDTVGTIMLDLEAQRRFLAAETFRRLAGEVAASGTAGQAAATAAGYLALAAVANHVWGDSLEVKPLVSEIAGFERRALSGRRGRLSRFVQALLLIETGRTDEGFVLLEDARGWAVAGFPRFDRELAQSAIAAGRPAVALAPLRAALRAPAGGWGGAVNRGDLHDLLGHAFAALGEVDSARVHYGWVARAWQGADWPLEERAAQARAWLEGDGRQSSR